MEIDNLISEINSLLKIELNSKIENFGLYSGLGSTLLYERYHSLFTNGMDFLSDSEVELLVSNILNEVNSTNTFSNGISGKLWMFSNLIKHNLIDAGIDEVYRYKALTCGQLLDFSKNNEWDNLHGAFGVLYFLADSGMLDEDTLSAFLLNINKGMYHQGTFIFYQSKPNFDKPEKNYNLSLAHGLAGHILILTKVLKSFPNNILLKNVLLDMVNFLLKYEATEPSLWYFPLLLHENESENNYLIGRLAWCYGDLGIGLALRSYSEELNNDFLKRKALNILMNCASKRGNENCMIADAPFCHGTAGVMHIFNRLFSETKINDFNLASDYWLEQTLKFYSENGLIGLKAKKFGIDVRPELSSYLLTGLSGIGLALLSKKHSNYESSWDHSLLFI